MNNRLILALLAAFIFGSAVARAQDDDDDDDQEFDYFAYFNRAHSNLKFGFRATEGAKVSFGNLGGIPAIVLSDLTASTPTRTYSNGSISVDSPRANEIDANGNQTSPANGTYQVSVGYYDPNGSPEIGADGKQITFVQGQYVSYVPGSTRNYSLNDPSQVVNGAVQMTAYSTNSEGATLTGKKALSSGVELQVERLFSDPSKRFRFSLVGGFSLNGINSKRAGTVTADLHAVTDSYALAGGAISPNATYPYSSAADFVSIDLPNSEGDLVSAQQESDVPLSTMGTRTESDVPDGAEVTGIWEIKGTYAVFRIGPELSASFTPNLSVNASAGFAAACVGTNYSATESTTLMDPTVLTPTITTGSLTSVTSKFLPGYYANFDASWAVNERTGFYAGMSYESYDPFDQTLDGRTARIDLGNASLRGGLNIKF